MSLYSVDDNGIGWTDDARLDRSAPLIAAPEADIVQISETS
jgi:hypothetical protein